MNKSMNKFFADQNVTQSLEQQFDYLFKCAGVKLMSCWDLKEHTSQSLSIKSERENFNRIPTVLYLFATINKISLLASQQWR